MTHQRKTAAEYGQLSLFEETVPEWLQPAKPDHDRFDGPAATICPPDDDDDLSHFMNWLQKNRDTPDIQE